MNMQPQKNERESEAFNMGAVAVGHVDDKEETPVTAGFLGSVAIKNTDQQLVEPGETIETVVHRHPIGIIGIYAEMIAGSIAILVTLILIVHGTFGTLSSGAKELMGAGALLLIGFMSFILGISAHVYHNSKIIITDQSLVAVLQKALFARKISRLSMSNVEDVTAEQQGILPSLLNYGVLTIQTAGEEDNFIFPYCPKPNDVADLILKERQAYAKKHDD